VRDFDRFGAEWKACGAKTIAAFDRVDVF